MFKRLLDSKIHFIAVASYIGFMVTFYFMEEGKGDFAIGALMGGLCIGLLAFQCQDVDRKEGRYFDSPPFEKPPVDSRDSE